jgi:hypothetical protein
MRDILPFRPTYSTTAVVEYHATIASPGLHVFRCERLDADEARRLGVPITHLPDAEQYWAVSLIDPSGRSAFLSAEPCERERSAAPESS